MPVKVTIWNEFRHEKESAEIAAIYPDGIHGAIAAGLAGDGDLIVRTATLDEPEHGLNDAVLADTEVLIWWGHKAHAAVQDEIVQRVQRRVLDGMGLVVLHSGHHSKIFKTLMGTTCNLAGIGEYIELPAEEMYGEFFDIPQPDDLVFVSWFTGGEVFRSGCCYQRGQGKIFYFRPGHETYPTYHNPEVLRVIDNAIHWAAPVDGPVPKFGIGGPNAPLEPLPPRT
jgi:trehalose utilization protein